MGKYEDLLWFGLVLRTQLRRPKEPSGCTGIPDLFISALRGKEVFIPLSQGKLLGVYHSLSLQWTQASGGGSQRWL